MKSTHALRSLVVLGSLSLLALTGCGKDVKRTGDRPATTQPQGTETSGESHGLTTPMTTTNSTGGSNENENESSNESNECEARKTSSNKPNSPGPNAPGPNAPGPNSKAPNSKAPNSSKCGSRNQQNNDGTGTTRPSRPSTRPTSRPSSRPTNAPTVSCEDNTSVPSNARRTSYDSIVNGKVGTWQLVSYKAYASARFSSKIVTSAVKGDALDEVTVRPECQDMRALPNGNFNWKMSMPMLFASKDGFVNDEIVYVERLEGERSASESARSMNVKAPSQCKILTGAGSASSACGQWEFYTVSDRKAVVVKTVETRDSSGRTLSVTVMGSYSWIEGEELLDNIPTSTEFTSSYRRTRAGSSAATAEPIYSSDDDEDRAVAWDDDAIYSANDSGTDHGSNDGAMYSADDTSVSGSTEASTVRVVYVGQRPHCYRVYSARDARRARRAVRRVIRKAKRGKTVVYTRQAIRACR